MLSARDLIGHADVILITLDALRYDVAEMAMATGLTKNFERLLPNGKWERRQTPGNFTFSAHQAFFAGFLPTPEGPEVHPRLLAARFDGSETTTESTYVFDAPDIVSGFAELNYRTICIGGVGFFNKQNELGRVLPSMFQESYWDSSMGVTGNRSAEIQFGLAKKLLSETPPEKPVFLFINVSALHQPNCMFTPDATTDSVETQLNALAYVDSCLPILFDAIEQRGTTLALICSDHGTAYGEDGYVGHRHNHPVVGTVPYAEFVMGGR